MRLSREKPTNRVDDMLCPVDGCEGVMKLNLGRYGRFYGCSKFKSGGCRGGYSAADDGTPNMDMPRVGRGRRARSARDRFNDWDHQRRKSRRKLPPPPTAWERILDNEFDDEPAVQTTDPWCVDEGDW